MNCRKYRACLMGLIAVAIVAGVLIFVKNIRANEVPAEGTLVKNCGAGPSCGCRENAEYGGNGAQVWA